MKVLERGDAVPHFAVTTLEGRPVRYADLWQRWNLVFAALPAEPGASDYVSELTARIPDFVELAAQLVLTRDTLPGLRSPGVLVADRWGEIVHVATASNTSDLPNAEALHEWLHWIETRCPECEGETR